MYLPSLSVCLSVSLLHVLLYYRLQHIISFIFSIFLWIHFFSFNFSELASSNYCITDYDHDDNIPPPAPETQYCRPFDINEADDRMKRYYGINFTIALICFTDLYVSLLFSLYYYRNNSTSFAYNRNSRIFGIYREIKTNSSVLLMRFIIEWSVVKFFGPGCDTSRRIDCSRNNWRWSRNRRRQNTIYGNII